MTILLAVALIVMMGAVLFVLAKGVIGMAQQKDISGARSQELMRNRVLYQAIAIVIAIVLLLVAGGKS